MVSPTPISSQTVRNGRSVTAAIGARRTGTSTVSGPMRTRPSSLAQILRSVHVRERLQGRIDGAKLVLRHHAHAEVGVKAGRLALARGEPQADRRRAAPRV